MAYVKGRRIRILHSACSSEFHPVTGEEFPVTHWGSHTFFWQHLWRLVLARQWSVFKFHINPYAAFGMGPFSPTPTPS